MLKMCLMNFVCKIPNGKWLGLSNWVFATLPPWTAIVNGWWWFGQWTLIWIFYARTEGSIEMAVGKWNNLNRKSDRCYFGLKNNILIFAAQTTIKSDQNLILFSREKKTLQKIQCVRELLFNSSAFVGFRVFRSVLHFQYLCLFFSGKISSHLVPISVFHLYPHASAFPSCSFLSFLHDEIFINERVQSKKLELNICFML